MVPITDRNLTQLQYAGVVKGQAYRLYLFGEDGYHGGGKWFTTGRIDPKEDVMDGLAAAVLEMTARSRGYETRVTNAMDELVFHTRGGSVLYPEGMSGSEFWRSL